MARRGDARFVAGADRPDRIPPATAPEVAFAGRSNVGKSSLLNRLVGRRSLARVGKTPGRTQQINFFALGEQLTLVDLPGYGFAKVPLPVKETWRRLIEAYLEGREALGGVVVLVDARRGVSDEDRELIDYLATIEVPCCVAATKIDKLKRSQRATQLRKLAQLGGALAALQLVEELPVHRVVACSATSGEGVAQLWQAIDSMVAV